MRDARRLRRRVAQGGLACAGSQLAGLARIAREAFRGTRAAIGERSARRIERLYGGGAVFGVEQHAAAALHAAGAIDALQPEALAFAAATARGGEGNRGLLRKRTGRRRRADPANAHCVHGRTVVCNLKSRFSHAESGETRAGAKFMVGRAGPSSRGRRSTRETPRQTRCRPRTWRAWSALQRVMIESSQCATASRTSGATAAASAIAHAMPSPVNGST